MFTLGIIEESLKDSDVLELVKPYFFSQRIENIPENECPVWHINEYHVPDEKIEELLEVLKEGIKLTWYIHAFNESKLYIVLSNRFFPVSLQRDETWEEMIEYGVKVANVERYFLENVPLNV